MRDYTATPTNPTIFSCYMMNHEASTLLPNDTLAEDLANAFDPMQPAIQEFDDYSIQRTDTHLNVTVLNPRTTATIPLAWVPRIIDDLTAPADADA